MKYDLSPLKIAFEKNADSDYAASMGKYLKNLFPFYGIQTPKRRELIKKFIKEQGNPDLSEIEEIVKTTMAYPQREWHYFAVEIFNKFLTKYPREKIELAEYMITTNSWWDTVDSLAVKAVGSLYKMYPELIPVYTEKQKDPK